MKTTLRNISSTTEDDFGIDFLEYQMLVRACDNGDEVEVLQIAVDGDTPEHSYFDIKLANGLTIDAIAGIHLAEIELFEAPTELIQCQLVVDIQYVKSGDCTINHSALEDIISVAINNQLLMATSVSEMKLHAIEVQYETEFTTKA